MKKKKRLLWQLFPSYLLITLIALFAVTFYATTSLKDFYLDQVASDLQARAHLLEKQIFGFVGPFDGHVVDALCKEMGRPSATRITVILPSEDVIGDSENDPAKMDNHALRPEIIDAKNGFVGSSIRFSSTLQKNMMYVAIPLREGKKILAVVRTSIPVTAIDKKLKMIEIEIGFGGLLIAILAAGFSLYVSRRISQPIEEMKRGADRFAGEIYPTGCRILIWSRLAAFPRPSIRWLRNLMIASKRSSTKEMKWKRFWPAWWKGSSLCASMKISSVLIRRLLVFLAVYPKRC